MMETFEVIMTPDAAADLIELRDYIADVLLVPETAFRYLRVIREAISRLEYMAASVALLPEEPWHSRGVRKIIVKNFIIYFRVDEAVKKVYVLNIIYDKRDQLRMLDKMKMD